MNSEKKIQSSNKQKISMVSNLIGKPCSSKHCKHKGVKQSYANFYNCKKAKDGYQSHCKDCLSADRNERMAIRLENERDFYKMFIG